MADIISVTVKREGKEELFRTVSLSDTDHFLNEGVFETLLDEIDEATQKARVALAWPLISTGS